MTFSTPCLTPSTVPDPRLVNRMKGLRNDCLADETEANLIMEAWFPRPAGISPRWLPGQDKPHKRL